MTGGDIITDEEFMRLRTELSADSAGSWLRIPWQVSLTQAMRAAAEQNKLVAMIVRSGHPLGCTCNNGLIDRVSIIEDPAVADLLTNRFVPLAVDQHIHRRLQNSEGRIFAELVKQSGHLPFAPRQGFYVFTAAGELVTFRHTQDPSAVRQMLVSALERANPEMSASQWLEPGEGTNFTLEVPRGIVVLDVTSKVLGGYAEASSDRERMLQSTRGRDHCWVRDDEVEALSGGIVPDSLITRIARFHLVDNTRGEPPMWHADQVVAAEASLRAGELTGTVRLETAAQRRGYSASLFGVVSTERGVLTEFDVVARGMAWGRGYYNGGAPLGRYPLAVRFTLARGAWPFDAIPPGAARTRADEYLGAPAGALA